MYQALLVFRYLTSRIIPLIAVAAVALCVTLVIVVVSVMTGFLDMLRSSGRTLVGDVIVSHDLVGIPYYEELITAIEKVDGVEAAAPVVETFGLVSMPYGVRGGNRVEMLSIWGIDPTRLQRVVDYKRMLYWQYPDDELMPTLASDDPRLDRSFDALDQAMEMRSPEGAPGMVLGIEISPFNQRQRDGSYRTAPRFGAPQNPDYWMVGQNVSLTVVPVTSGGTLKAENRTSMRIVNEFRTGVFQFDNNRVLVGLAELQKMLSLDESTQRDPVDGTVLGVKPARATTILVRAKEGVDPNVLKDRIAPVVDEFLAAKASDPAVLKAQVIVPAGIEVKTWEERLESLIGPVEKERALMRTLFSLIYVVCAGLVLAIFWAIVAEKTRDIGILRSVGAGRVGILAIFLAYGLVIGVLGSGVGLGLAALVVGHINEIHTAMGQPPPAAIAFAAAAAAFAAILAAVYSARRGSVLYTLLWLIVAVILGGLAFLFNYLRQTGGFTIWDPRVYYFSRIPSQLDLANALLTMAFATLFSVIGAAVPAAKAADTDPVRSLRYE
ncbi:MAG: ABC transporter permease [Phycisphaerae bacterium]|nr:ABC transporter permease [Phycisphaerae bacterium]